MTGNKDKILEDIAALEARLKVIDEERGKLSDELSKLRFLLAELPQSSLHPDQSVAIIDSQSPLNKKISLFRSLFRGREDVYPKLWVSKKTGAKGYSPVCENEWINGVCNKPKIKCGACDNRKLSSLSNDVIRRHLDGLITIGTYPMRQDETCYFLAIDFDKQTWIEDVKAFIETCIRQSIPVSLERSRSGNGGHNWIFFSEPIPSSLARQLGSYLITETMSNRHEIDMKSYDRLFPNQDTLPRGGFGNLIALPLQKIPAEKGNSVFLDDNLNPYHDQWLYLSGVKKMTLKEVEAVINDAIKSKDIIGVSMGQTDDVIKPWEKPLAYNQRFEKLSCALPAELTVIMANRIYIKKKGLPSPLLNKIKRLAAFQNPEFYKKQSMRLSTALTPRVICCSEIIDDYMTIPRGCLEDLKELCTVNNISLSIDDKRFAGELAKFNFHGELSETQKKQSRN